MRRCIGKLRVGLSARWWRCPLYTAALYVLRYFLITARRQARFWLAEVPKRRLETRDANYFGNIFCKEDILSILACPNCKGEL